MCPGSARQFEAELTTTAAHSGRLIPESLLGREPQVPGGGKGYDLQEHYHAGHRTPGSCCLPLRECLAVSWDFGPMKVMRVDDGS